VSDRDIKLLLFLTILVVSVLPLIAALYFLDRSLQTSLNLGFNPHITRVLEDSSSNLLTLRKLDPRHQAKYREQFETIEQLRHVYARPALIRRSVLKSLRIYFGLGLVASVAFSVLVAALLSRRIARAYTQTFDELLAQREKVRYLQEISAWQELAKMLAHEIKNPLTPIEVLVSSLRKAHAQLSNEDFGARLAQTQTMIGEELQHLKRTVDHFSDFARLPEVKLELVDLPATLSAQLQAVASMFPSASIDWDAKSATGVRARIDPTLLRQVLTNIVRNGVEANPGCDIRFVIRLSDLERSLELSLRNDGVPVPGELVPRLFDPYVSGVRGKDNMGLGLAIVRKILIDHGGDIRYELQQGHPAFVISLPGASHE
jgi:signal transduction histidine kinase